MDSEEVISELEDIQKHLDTGYSFVISWKSKLIRDTLALLKEQEAKPMTESDDGWDCPRCGLKLVGKQQADIRVISLIYQMMKL